MRCDDVSEEVPRALMFFLLSWFVQLKSKMKEKRFSGDVRGVWCTPLMPAGVETFLLWHI
jgi:hypothetical protein